MTKFKKIIPALCMLLISAVLMGTSTYAWFSMNTTVKATGMEVKAKSQSEFLQIINEVGEFSDETAQSTANAKNPSNTIKPVAAVKEITTNAITALDDTITADAIKWAEAFSADPAVSAKATDYREVTTSIGDYTLLNTFKVRMNPKTGVSSSAKPLKVVEVKVAGTNASLQAAVSVLFVCGDNYVLWKNNKFVVTKVAENVLVNQVTAATPTEIKVYIFFDGEDVVTTTNNAAALDTKGYNVEFSLSI